MGTAGLICVFFCVGVCSYSAAADKQLQSMGVQSLGEIARWRAACDSTQRGIIWGE